MRLIDADALKERIMMDVPGFDDGGSTLTKAFIMAMVGTRNATPTIDAVPVIRCKDCKYACFSDDGELLYCENVKDEHGNMRRFYRERDWFCADGEKAETVDEGYVPYTRRMIQDNGKAKERWVIQNVKYVNHGCD